MQPNDSPHQPLIRDMPAEDRDASDPNPHRLGLLEATRIATVASDR